MRGIRVLTAAAVVIIVAAVAEATPPEIVEEDFEGSQFPPSGWFASGTWRRAEEGENHYAHASEMQGVSRLLTCKFRLEQGTGIDIEFEYRAGWSGMGSHVVQVHLYYGTYSMPTSFWKRDLPAYATWIKNRSMNVRVSETRDDCFCGWLVGAVQYRVAWFDVDDITVDLVNTGVEATSLGRARALYR